MTDNKQNKKNSNNCAEEMGDIRNAISTHELFAQSLRPKKNFVPDKSLFKKNDEPVKEYSPYINER